MLLCAVDSRPKSFVSNILAVGALKSYRFVAFRPAGNYSQRNRKRAALAPLVLDLFDRRQKNPCVAIQFSFTAVRQLCC